jgi:hypothetical protein
MIFRQETINGCVMSYDEAGRLVGRQGGLFWDMQCEFDDTGNLTEYNNSLGYSIERFYSEKYKRQISKWNIPPNDPLGKREQFAKLVRVKSTKKIID